MQFFALDNNESILAQEALRHKNYLCPECGSLLRVREGPHRRAHFYHIKENILCRQHKKSLTHLAVQMHLQSILPQSEAVLESPFPQVGRIADVFWKTKNIVFEVQCSAISLQEAKQRSLDYQKMGIKLVWILHQKRFNKKSLSAAEDFLRVHTNCYFTTMDEKGNGMIYDQFDVCHKNKRVFTGNPLKVDLKSPSPFPAVPIKPECPLIIKKRVNTWPLYFPGDLIFYLLKEKTLFSILEIEKRLLLINPSPSFSFLKAIKKAYFTLFHILLEKASQ